MADQRRSAPPEGTTHDEGHGHSTAAWTGVTVTLIGAAVLSVAVVLASLWLGIIGAVVMVAGPVVGKVMTMMGFGPHVSLDSAVEDEGPGQDKAAGGVR